MKKKFDVGSLIKRDEWLIGGDNFTITITHVLGRCSDEKPVHCWCLYVTISSGHRLFDEACNNTVDYDCSLGDKIYGKFHGGCTFYSKQRSYVKIGCDYQHLWDDYYMECEKLPGDILDDAEELFEFMQGGEE